MSIVTAHEHVVLPDDVDVDAIAENALQAGFKVICDQLAEAGYPVSGDVYPWEAHESSETFKAYVRMMALNNDAIGALQPCS